MKYLLIALLKTLLEWLQRWTDILSRRLEKAERAAGARFVVNVPPERQASEATASPALDATALTSTGLRQTPPVASSPPAHWTEQTRSSGPPAHWLAKVQAAQAANANNKTGSEMMRPPTLVESLADAAAPDAKRAHVAIERPDALSSSPGRMASSDQANVETTQPQIQHRPRTPVPSAREFSPPTIASMEPAQPQRPRKPSAPIHVIGESHGEIVPAQVRSSTDDAPIVIIQGTPPLSAQRRQMAKPSHEPSSQAAHRGTMPRSSPAYALLQQRQLREATLLRTATPTAYDSHDANSTPAETKMEAPNVPHTPNASNAPNAAFASRPVVDYRRREEAANDPWPTLPLSLLDIDDDEASTTIGDHDQSSELRPPDRLRKLDAEQRG